jgi:hypothetical protein
VLLRSQWYTVAVPSKKGSVKASYDFTPEAKFNLARLKAELRYKGVPATETGILEVLLNGAEADDRFIRAYRRYIEPE